MINDRKTIQEKNKIKKKYNLIFKTVDKPKHKY